MMTNIKTNSSVDNSAIAGDLYIVSTPIGNLDDITYRAITILSNVDLILAEDTRTTHKLLAYYGIDNRLQAVHDFNEKQISRKLISQLQQGKRMALVSEAGTPLINDPGYTLVLEAHKAGIKVYTVPGPCAVVAALSISGLATDRFRFEGFLPSKSSLRRKQLGELAAENCTLVFYEAPHRLGASILDMIEVFGADREVTLVKEMTKLYESVYVGTLEQHHQFISHNADKCKGEWVIIVAKSDTSEGKSKLDIDTRKLLLTLSSELPVAKVAKVAAKITGEEREDLYRQALKLKGIVSDS